MMELILSFIVAWICTLSGVALGGWLVFRTKRDSHESLFSSKPPEGESFNVFDGEVAPIKSKAALPKELDEANETFLEQFAERLAKK